MNSPLQKIESMLSTGQAPTYGDLENALAQALQERATYQTTTQDMTNWLSSLVTAHLCKDMQAIHDILACFIDKKVKIVRPLSKEVH
ncbi:hypothetical protein [Undibacterium sp. Ren11W]|uniref:hypothetical protein n=1 Tax=Undibacterium sp. Ren11W TaxID=3413045 RepID=UPI003BF435DB